MKISWLFEIEHYRWSTKNVTHDNTAYTAKILPDSFDGIPMRWDITNRGLITPSDLSFDVENTDGYLFREDVEKKYVTVILVTDGMVSRKWKFYVDAAAHHYGKLTLFCVDLLQAVSVGEYPNTLHPREAFPSNLTEEEDKNEDGEDTYRVPISFGKAYIPIMPVYAASLADEVTLDAENLTYSVADGESVIITGSDEANTITIAAGGKAILLSSDGANSVIINSNQKLFSISRWGDDVDFVGFDGTFLRITASETAQTVTFSDTTAETLQKDTSGNITFGGTWYVTTAKKYYPEKTSPGGPRVSQLHGLHPVLDMTIHSKMHYTLSGDGSTTANTIIFRESSKAHITRCPGENIIILTEGVELSDLTVTREGKWVTIRESGGMVCQLFATEYDQTIRTRVIDPEDIHGDDYIETDYTLELIDDVVFFNSTEVPELEIGPVQDDEVHYLLGERGDTAPPDEVLTVDMADETSPYATVANKSYAIYGTTGNDSITIAAGAKVTYIVAESADTGLNTFTFASHSSLFYVRKTSESVFVQGFDGSHLELPQKTQDQTLAFSDQTVVLSTSGDDFLIDTETITALPKFFPDLNQWSTEITTEALFGSVEVAADEAAIVYGIDEIATNLVVNAGAKVFFRHCTNDSTANIINLPGAFADFKIYKVGSLVIFLDTSTYTYLRMSATTDDQEIDFTDGRKTLVSVGGRIFLDDTEVNVDPNIQTAIDQEENYYEVLRVKDPPSIGKYEYTLTPDEETGHVYEFPLIEREGEDGADYILAQFMIAYDPDKDDYDAGTWHPLEKKPLVQYRVIETPQRDAWNPADVFYKVSCGFGINPSDIDLLGTFEDARAVYTTQGIEWAGAFYETEMKESVWNELCSLCDSTIYISDKVELHPFSKTSQETFDKTKIKELSFTPARNKTEQFDSGRVRWVEPDTPQTELTGKKIVPITDAGSTKRPMSDTFQARFINDGEVAQKLGILFFQRQQIQDTVSFNVPGGKMSALDTLRPGQVITVKDGLYGGEQDLIVASLHIGADLNVSVTALRLQYIKEFTDVTGGGGDPIGDPEPGKDTPEIHLSATSTIFTFDPDGVADPADQSITFSATDKNMNSGNYIFYTNPDIGSQVSLSNTFILTDTDFADNKSVTVTVKKSGKNKPVTDSVTVLRVQAGLNRRIKSNVEASLFRIIIELINNTVKHAHANNALIDIKLLENKLLLNYSDDGIGFELQSVLEKAKGQGLVNIINRTN